MTTPSNCLNCNHPLTGKYCNNCGQKADTHRITFKHFISHDLIHGVFHIDRGLFYTIKESLFRPGIAGMNYIKGKRVKYYNVFYLTLILLGLLFAMLHFLLGVSPISVNSSEDFAKLGEFFKKNYKLFMLILIPVMAKVAWLVFRKWKLNLLEHFIISGFISVGLISFEIIKTLFRSIPEPVSVVSTYFFTPLIIFIQLILPGLAYYQAYKEKNLTGGFLWRILVYYVLVITIYIVALVIFLILFLYIATGKTDFEGELGI